MEKSKSNKEITYVGDQVIGSPNKQKSIKKEGQAHGQPLLGESLKDEIE